MIRRKIDDFRQEEECTKGKLSSSDVQINIDISPMR